MYAKTSKCVRHKTRPNDAVSLVTRHGTINSSQNTDIQDPVSGWSPCHALCMSASHHIIISPSAKNNRGNQHLNTGSHYCNSVIFAGFGFRQAFQPFIQPVQSFNHDVFQPFMQGVMHMIMGDHDHGHKFTDDGTESPQVKSLRSMWFRPLPEQFREYSRY